MSLRHSRGGALTAVASAQAELAEVKEAAEAQHSALAEEHTTLAANAATLADATLKAQARDYDQGLCTGLLQ